MDETRRTRPRCWDLHVDQWRSGKHGSEATPPSVVSSPVMSGFQPGRPDLFAFSSRVIHARFCGTVCHAFVALSPGCVPGTGSTSVALCSLVRFVISLQLHNVRSTVLPGRTFQQEAVKSSSPLNSSGTGSASCACAISIFSMGPTNFTHWEIYISFRFATRLVS